MIDIPFLTRKNSPCEFLCLMRISTWLLMWHWFIQQFNKRKVLILSDVHVKHRNSQYFSLQKIAPTKATAEQHHTAVFVNESAALNKLWEPIIQWFIHNYSHLLPYWMNECLTHNDSDLSPRTGGFNLIFKASLCFYHHCIFLYWIFLFFYLKHYLFYKSICKCKKKQILGANIVPYWKRCDCREGLRRWMLKASGGTTLKSLRTSGLETTHPSINIPNKLSKFTNHC